MVKTCVKVDPGICGFTCRIEGWRKEKRIAGLRILDTQCEMIRKLSQSIEEITIANLFLPLTRNPVFVSAQQAGCHSACPVPVALVKLSEVVLELAIPQNVSIEFKKSCD